MNVRSLISLPYTSFVNWATRPLVLEKKDDFERITEYGLWRSVTLGSKDLIVYEGFTDKKHIVIFSGDKLNFDAAKNRAFAEFQKTVECVTRGNRSGGKGIYDCLNDRFPQKPSNTLLLIEGLEKTSPWLVDFMQQGGRVWTLPTFQDAARELLASGHHVDRYDIKNLLLATASCQLQTSGLKKYEPELVLTETDNRYIEEIINAIQEEAGDKQSFRAYHFRDLMKLKPEKFESDLGGSLAEAKRTYNKIMQKADELRSQKIKKAASDRAGSLLIILSDMDHRGTLVSSEDHEELEYGKTGKLLNGEVYRGHNLKTWLMPYYRHVEIVSG